MARASFKCPSCGQSVWDNRQDRRNDKAPLYKCSNKQCSGGKNGQAWASWDDPPKGVQAAASASNGSGPAAPAPTTFSRLSQDQFVLITNDLTFVLMDGLKKACLKHDVDISPTTLVEQTMTTVRQAWITYEKGAIRLGPEPEQPPPPMKPKERYYAQITQCGDVLSVARLMATIGGDAALDGTEKEELAEAANARLGILQAAGELKG